MRDCGGTASRSEQWELMNGPGTVTVTTTVTYSVILLLLLRRLRRRRYCRQSRSRWAPPAAPAEPATVTAANGNASRLEPRPGRQLSAARIQVDGVRDDGLPGSACDDNDHRGQCLSAGLWSPGSTGHGGQGQACAGHRPGLPALASMIAQTRSCQCLSGPGP
jgi:hypothetical protein